MLQMKMMIIQDFRFNVNLTMKYQCFCPSNWGIVCYALSISKLGLDVGLAFSNFFNCFILKSVLCRALCYSGNFCLTSSRIMRHHSSYPAISLLSSWECPAALIVRLCENTVPLIAVLVWENAANGTGLSGCPFLPRSERWFQVDVSGLCKV